MVIPSKNKTIENPTNQTNNGGKNETTTGTKNETTTGTKNETTTGTKNETTTGGKTETKLPSLSNVNLMIIGDSVPWVKYNVYENEARSLYNWKVFKGTGNSCPTILRETN